VKTTWSGKLFWFLIALHLIPVWAVTAVPTTDGPSHVYNAWILQQHATGRESPLFRQSYQVDKAPLPNWTSHAVLALLMVPFAPATAEKILVSAYVVLFLLGARYLTTSTDPDPERAWLAFLAFPFVYNQTLQWGFYNFGLSLGLFLFALGFWWRRRAEPGLRLAIGLNLILLLCYFSHILSTVLALFGIGVLWLATLRRAPLRRHLLHIPILAPQAVLPLWFVSTHGAEPTAGRWTTTFLLRYFARNEVLYTFSPAQLVLGSALTALFAGLAIATVWGRRPLAFQEEDGFLVIAAAVILLFFFGPEGMSGGSLIKIRLCLYPWLLLLPWIAPRLSWPGGRPVRGALVTVLALVAVVNAAAYVHWYRQADRDVQAFLAAARPIQPGSRVLPALFDRRASIGVQPLLGHAIDRLALEKGLLDWGSYEAQTGLFPIRFRPGVPYPSLWQLEVMPAELDVDTHRDQIDAVFCWKMPPDSPLAARLRRHYGLMNEQGPARLYEVMSAGMSVGMRK
jgi:hypothetical protein